MDIVLRGPPFGLRLSTFSTYVTVFSGLYLNPAVQGPQPQVFILQVSLAQWLLL